MGDGKTAGVAADDVDPTSNRERLLGLVADLILERGVADLSLSEVARSIGTTNRMLLYYFGTKEAVLNAACLVAFGRFPQIDGMIERLQTGPGDARERLNRAWADIAHPDNRPFLALFFEAFGIALHQPGRNRGFFEHVGASWVPELRDVLREAGLSEGDAATSALQIVASWRGMQFALLLGTPEGDLSASYAALVDRLLARA